MKLSKSMLCEEFQHRLVNLTGKPLEETSLAEKYLALSSLIRDSIARQWSETDQRRRQEDQKKVYYLSIEFLLGRLLGMHLLNLGIRDIWEEALAELGISLAEVEAVEEDPGLGNGGLGRLAACYLESMAAQGLAGHGCGLRYSYGFFEQKIINGYQRELPDNWLKDGNIWEFRQREEAVTVKFGGQVHTVKGGRLHYVHDAYEAVQAVPYDLPVTGFLNHTVNTLRLWKAEPAAADFVCSLFDHKDCTEAIEYKASVESITNVLYPDDSTQEGRLLRLKQQYFLVSASLQSIIRQYKQRKLPLTALPEYVAIHINDTHPALAVPEMMRILIDEEGLGWEEAWPITVRTLSYTNHTVLPEALERWPVDLFQSLLPRIFIIVNEINERLCHELWQRYPGQWEHIRSMAVIADGQVHMAHLAIAGCHSVNGVAQIHTEILKSRVMANFHDFYPGKFNNKTNGVAHRRWLCKVNPRLAALITEAIGEGWISHPCELVRISKFSNDAAFLAELAAVKRHNKTVLAAYIRERNGISVNPDSIFDAQIKRIHGYKRQIMNALHILHLYNLLRENPAMDMVPRTFIFAGKAAPSYHQAKRTIKLITTLAEIINQDPVVREKIKVVFLENYNVSLAEVIIPGTDVSEQIPTASREACGTGNMKFMMNGAVTMGTLDGANIEISNAIGEGNIITFGLTPEEVLNYYQFGGYNPWDIYHGDIRVKTVMDQLVNGFFPDGEEFRPLHDALLYHNDEYFVLKDFPAYAEAQQRVARYYQDKSRWLNMCLQNIAHAGKFSGDRTFVEYAVDIWKMTAPEPVRCYCRSDLTFLQQQRGCVYRGQAGKQREPETVGVR